MSGNQPKGWRWSELERTGDGNGHESDFRHSRRVIKLDKGRIVRQRLDLEERDVGEGVKTDDFSKEFTALLEFYQNLVHLVDQGGVGQDMPVLADEEAGSDGEAKAWLVLSGIQFRPLRLDPHDGGVVLPVDLGDPPLEVKKVALGERTTEGQKKKRSAGRAI